MSLSFKTLTIVLLVSIFNTGNLYAKSVSIISQDAFKSVVMIVMRGNDGKAISLGSGFIIEPGVVATNGHVIENGEGGYVKLVYDDNKYEIIGILAVDTNNDLALLKIAKDTLKKSTHVAKR